MARTEDNSERSEEKPPKPEGADTFIPPGLEIKGPNSNNWPVRMFVLRGAWAQRQPNQKYDNLSAYKLLTEMVTVTRAQTHPHLQAGTIIGARVNEINRRKR